jgi:hypothetical protein
MSDRKRSIVLWDEDEVQPRETPFFSFTELLPLERMEFLANAFFSLKTKYKIQHAS